MKTQVRSIVLAAAAAAAAAGLQLLGGLRQMQSIKASVELRTRPDALWKSITNHEELPRHVAMLREVKVIDAKAHGVGTIRQCTLSSGRSFHEEITAWEEGHRYCYQPDVGEAHFPFKWAEACWSIQPHGEGSLLTYNLRYEPASRLRDLINYPLLRFYGFWQIKKMLRSYDIPNLP